MCRARGLSNTNDSMWSLSPRTFFSMPSNMPCFETIVVIWTAAKRTVANQVAVNGMFQRYDSYRFIILVLTFLTIVSTANRPVQAKRKVAVEAANRRKVNRTKANQVAVNGMFQRHGSYRFVILVLTFLTIVSTANRPVQAKRKVAVEANQAVDGKFKRLIEFAFDNVVVSSQTSHALFFIANNDDSKSDTKDSTSSSSSKKSSSGSSSGGGRADSGKGSEGRVDSGKGSSGGGRADSGKGSEGRVEDSGKGSGRVEPTPKPTKVCDLFIRWKSSVIRAGCIPNQNPSFASYFSLRQRSRPLLGSRRLLQPRYVSLFILQQF